MYFGLADVFAALKNQGFQKNFVLQLIIAGAVIKLK